MSQPTLSPKWVVVRVSNGSDHYEAYGPLIQSFPTLLDAENYVNELCQKHHGTAFAICALVSEHLFEPRLLVRKVK